MFKLKTGIKAKILIVMLVLTVISVGLAAVLTLSNIRLLGNYTLDACDELGDNTLKSTQETFVEHACEQLLSLVIAQAMIANVQLDRIEDEMAMIANLSGKYLLGGENPITGGDEDRFLCFKKPFRPLERSRIIVYNQDKINNPLKYKRQLVGLGRSHPLMKFIYGNQRSVDLVFLCTNDGYYMTYPWTTPRKGYSPYDRKWYNKAIAANGKNVWVGPYISANGNKIIMTCAKAIKNFKGDIFAISGLDLTVKTITQDFVSSQLVAQGRSFLIDGNGNVLARKNMKAKGMKWYDDFRKENLLKSESMAMRHVAAKMVAGKQGVEKVSMAGEPELYVAYAPIPITKWSIGIAVNAELVTDSASKVEKAMERNIRIHRTSIKNYFDKNLKIYIIIGGIILLLVMGWGLVFSRRITAPVLMLKEKALKIMKGDFNSGIHLNTGDELERLDKSFDMMTHEINRYMKNAASTFREREKIEQEFAVAGNIQTLMLPTKFQETDKIKIDSLLKPAREVSGDFYNYFMVDDKHLFFCLGKVSGRGVPAAMLMAQFMTLLSHLGATKITPEKLLLMTNNTLVINNKTDMSSSAFCGYLNTASGELVYSNAEHIPALRVQDGVISGLEMEGTHPLGIESLSEAAFQCKHMRLQPGDILVFTTNGIAGEINVKGEVFGEKYLLNSFAGFKEAECEALEFAMLEMKEFYGVQFEKTDVSILTIEYKGGRR